jgi:hypothetical protein
VVPDVAVTHHDDGGAVLHGEYTGLGQPLQRVPEAMLFGVVVQAEAHVAIITLVETQ